MDMDGHRGGRLMKRRAQLCAAASGGASRPGVRQSSAALAGEHRRKGGLQKGFHGSGPFFPLLRSLFPPPAVTKRQRTAALQDAGATPHAHSIPSALPLSRTTNL